MEIDHCSFPDNLLFDLENLVWVEIKGDIALIGATSILAGLAGKLTAVRFNPSNSNYERGRSLGTVESVRFVGALRTPLTGKLIDSNSRLRDHPKLLNDSPYDDGWFARLQISRLDEVADLKPIQFLKDEASRKIAELHIRCFKVYPDYEMYEVGSECAKVLAHLNDLLPHVTMGEIVHIVSDDPTAYVEMVRWSEQTGNRLVDWREEGKISHFLVEKVG